MDLANGQGLNDASGQMMFRPHRAMHGISPMAPVSGERWSVAGRSPVGRRSVLSPVGAIAGRCYRRSVLSPVRGNPVQLRSRPPAWLHEFPPGNPQHR